MVWWILAAFIGGGFLGMLLLAVMHMASDEPKHSTQIPDFDVTRW